MFPTDCSISVDIHFHHKREKFILAKEELRMINWDFILLVIKQFISVRERTELHLKSTSTSKVLRNCERLKLANI